MTAPEDLADRLGAALATDPAITRTRGHFPMRVSRSFLNRITPGLPHDPLLLQILPQLAESDPLSPGLLDPLGEIRLRTSPRLIRKYHGRALLLASAECSVHCRYCFRQHFPIRDAIREDPDCEQALAELRADHSVREVILSGGDPLTLSDRRLATLAARLAALSHVATLRIHTREPVVRPARIQETLMQALLEFPRNRVLVIHANHPNELAPAVGRGLDHFRKAGFHLLNQSVLLAHVNDEVEVLLALSERLFSYGVLPYYLHLLDPVQGSAHFAVPDERAQSLHAELRARLPGYLVPRLVREIPGARSKTPLASGPE
ncbi:lysine 2,3-aminomutase YodO family protein [mine drainage metagenome]|uniref:L-lysine 2,3-aminomutase n=1 Tax=mine drainage metagenome TaxID=410659 RepID=T0ZWL8_9ZZZZ